MHRSALGVTCRVCETFNHLDAVMCKECGYEGAPLEMLPSMRSIHHLRPVAPGHRHDCKCDDCADAYLETTR